MPTRVFQPLAARLAVVGLVPAAVAWWLAGPQAGLAAAVLLLALELWRVRCAVLSGLPREIAFSPASPDDYEWLDRDAFRREFDSLADAGFTPITDFTVGYSNGTAPAGIARLFVNTRHRAYAEVSQVLAGAEPLPVATTIMSSLSDEWMLQTTSREPQPVMVAFMASSRSVWRSHPGVTPERLLDDHLALRTAMCVDLGVGIEGEGTREDYFGRLRAHHARQVDSAGRGGNIVPALLRGLVSERRPRLEWLGGYRATTTAEAAGT